MLTGITSHGIGNWKKIAEHVGTRTKEEVEDHYKTVYIESRDWPLPVSASRYVLLYDSSMYYVAHGSRI